YSGRFSSVSGSTRAPADTLEDSLTTCVKSKPALVLEEVWSQELALSFLKSSREQQTHPTQIGNAPLVWDLCFSTRYLKNAPKELHLQTGRRRTIPLQQVRGPFGP